MQRLLTLCVAAAGGLVADCGHGTDLGPVPDPPPGYAFAYATRDCAPWDGPAVTLYLTGVASDEIPPSGPLLQISIYKAHADLAGRTFQWPSDPELGGGSLCSTAATCESVPEGRVQFRSARPDSSLAGTVFLRTADGGTVHGGFNASWRDRPILCG